MSLAPVDLPPLEPTSVRPGGQWQPPPAEGRVVAPAPPSDAWSITGAGWPTRPEEVFELLLTWPETRNLQTPPPLVQLKQLFETEALDPSDLEAAVRKLQTLLKGSSADSVASDWTNGLAHLLRTQLAPLAEQATGDPRKADGLSQFLRHALLVLDRENAAPPPAPRTPTPPLPSIPSARIARHVGEQSYTFSERETAAGLLTQQPAVPAASSGNPGGKLPATLPSPNTPGAADAASPTPQGASANTDDRPNIPASDRGLGGTASPPSSRAGSSSPPAQTVEARTQAASAQASSTLATRPQATVSAPAPATAPALAPTIPLAPTPLTPQTTLPSSFVAPSPTTGQGTMPLQPPLPGPEPALAAAASNPAQPSPEPPGAPISVQPSLAEIVVRIDLLNPPALPTGATRWPPVDGVLDEATPASTASGHDGKTLPASPAPSSVEQTTTATPPLPPPRNSPGDAYRTVPQGQPPAAPSPIAGEVEGHLRAETLQTLATPAARLDEASQHAVMPQQRVGLVPLMVGQEALPAWLRLEWLPVHDREGRGGQEQHAQALMVSVHVAGETLGRVAFHLAWLPRELAGTIVLEKPEALRAAQEELPDLETRLAEAGLPPPRLRLLQHASVPWEEETQEVERT